MKDRRISVKWTGRVQRGSTTRKLTRYLQARHITDPDPPAGRKLTTDEAVKFALDRYAAALHRLARTD